VRLTVVGHATVLIEVQGARLLTDPLLRHRVMFLRGGRDAPAPGPIGDVDAVLLSHFHRDHYDPPSLRALDPGTLFVGPPGTARRLRRHGRRNVVELRTGDETVVGGVTVRATKAAHGRTPRPFRPIALGFLVLGGERLYFAGDTDLFPELADLAAEQLDVALLPVGGWGPRLGAGHLDPGRAAEALRLIRPRIAVPIHWGVLRPLGLGRLRPRYLTEPGADFARLAAKLAPEVDVRVVEPGESLEIHAPARPPARPSQSAEA
jgi:L-ascorbate metabolism protein UlaG (beta-lactamase superfamily)